MDEKSIEAIFATAPEHLTDDEVQKVVEYFQGKRTSFLTSPEAKPKGKAKGKIEADVNLKIEDLGL